MTHRRLLNLDGGQLRHLAPWVIAAIENNSSPLVVPQNNGENVFLVHERDPANNNFMPVAAFHMHDMWAAIGGAAIAAASAYNPLCNYDYAHHNPRAFRKHMADATPTVQAGISGRMATLKFDWRVLSGGLALSELMKANDPSQLAETIDHEINRIERMANQGIAGIADMVRQLPVVSLLHETRMGDCGEKAYDCQVLLANKIIEAFGAVAAEVTAGLVDSQPVDTSPNIDNLPVIPLHCEQWGSALGRESGAALFKAVGKNILDAVRCGKIMGGFLSPDALGELATLQQDHPEATIIPRRYAGKIAGDMVMKTVRKALDNAGYFL